MLIVKSLWLLIKKVNQKVILSGKYYSEHSYDSISSYNEKNAFYHVNELDFPLKSQSSSADYFRNHAECSENLNWATVFDFDLGSILINISSSNYLHLRKFSLFQFHILYIISFILLSHVSLSDAQFPLQSSDDEDDDFHNSKSDQQNCPAVTRCHRFSDGRPKTCETLKRAQLCLLLAKNCRGNLLYQFTLTNSRLEMKNHGCVAVNENDVQVSQGYGPVDGSDSWLHPESDGAAAAQRCVAQRGKFVYRNCALFGRPHLRDFAGGYSTCELEGSRVLIDNRHFTVQVSGGTGPGRLPGLTRVTVVIKPDRECVGPNFASYTVLTGRRFPQTLDSGGTVTGLNQAVVLHVSELASRAEVILRHLDVRIIVRKVSGLLSVTVRLPDPVLRTAIAKTPSAKVQQLCSTGCSPAEIVRMPEKGRQKMGVSAAEKQCRLGGLRGHFLDMCVLDLTTTGHTKYLEVALMAQLDMGILSRDARSNRSYFVFPTTAAPVAKAAGGPPLTPVHFCLLSLCLIFLLFR